MALGMILPQLRHLNFDDESYGHGEQEPMPNCTDEGQTHTVLFSEVTPRQNGSSNLSAWRAWGRYLLECLSCLNLLIMAVAKATSPYPREYEVKETRANCK